MDVTVIDHPLVATRLAQLRDIATDSAAFRSTLHELSTLLVYEALRDVAVRPVEVVTPITATKGVVLEDPPLLVPVLRAGLGMADAAHELVPEAQMGFIGLARDEETHQPSVYMESVPASLDGRHVVVLDPMLATGGSLAYCCELLRNRGAGRVIVVCVLAAPEGLAVLRASGGATEVVTASVDECLNENAYIVPGLGDAGDRQFGDR